MKLYFVLLMLLGSLYASFFYVIKGVTLMQFWGATVICIGKIGFIILLTSIFTFFLFGEIRNLTTLCVLPLVNNGFSLSFFFLSLLSYLWIGAQFPQEKFLSYARILTLYYYFLLMCILFLKKK